MKVLVATPELQGQRPNDFCWTQEHEPVFFSRECSRQRVDGSCGCCRSMSGMISGKSTTTMTVIDDPMATEESLKALLHQRQVDDGWAKYSTPEALQACIDQDVARLIALANTFEVGTIIERREQGLQPRVSRSRRTYRTRSRY